MAGENPFVGVSKDDFDAFSKTLNTMSADIRGFAEDVNKKMAKGETITQELKDKIDKELTETNGKRDALIAEFSAKVDAACNSVASQAILIHDLEQKLARGGMSGDGRVLNLQTPGAQFLASEEFLSTKGKAVPSKGVIARVPMTAITTNSVGATRDVLVAPDRLPGFIPLPDRRLVVRDLLTPGRTISNAIQYVRELGFDNQAATVSEGALKPQSDADFELKTTPVATIAHFILASKQILDDAAQLQSYIDGRLRYGVAYAEEQQLLYGTGTGTDIDGIMPNATNFSRTFLPETPTRIDDIRLAMLQSELALFPATGIVLNPVDWARIEMTKDTIGRYLIQSSNDGQGNASFRLWGQEVVSTPAMVVTNFLVGAFKLGAQIFDREDANVELSTEDSDNFRRNLVTIRGEERLALAIYRRGCFVKGVFQTAT